MTPETLGTTLAILLSVAWLLPLLGFVVELIVGSKSPTNSKTAAYIAVFCIATGFVCSTSALVIWGTQTEWVALASHDDHHGHDEGDAANSLHGAGGEVDAGHAHAKGDHDHKHGGEKKHEEHPEVQTVFAGSLYTLGEFGSIDPEVRHKVSFGLDYYIDSLTLVMFVMVTFIATCIHVFAMGYMDDELTDDHVDHEVHLSNGKHLHRPGRYYRFFAYLSLFCFSMLGLVIAGNVFQVFIFWELVGVCSYLLIGFYTERHSASTAANKAFIMNRVGDFGFLIGLMILVTSLGTFKFGDTHETHDDHTHTTPGLFTLIRGEDGVLHTDNDESPSVAYLHGPSGEEIAGPDRPAIPYWLLVAAGLGVFAGCVGKSAQFPLHTWLPDAMEGPTPVSALVHSATMVAAGVYLVGRFFPVFTPEVLLVIAYVGCITAFLGATIAVVATDIKKVLAYSTVSQLGYMMLALGVGGWGAGLFHLVTHAFFKSLMFLCSGSVIHACHHEQEMPKMGGLLKKMPITALTMLVGVIAITGLAIPGVIAFSGYYSKDAIIATSLAYANENSVHFLLFLIPLITAGITAFYMFRMWFYTFLGKPRDQHIYDHAHESAPVMTGPLLALSIFAAFVAVRGEDGVLYKLLTHSEPSHVAGGVLRSGSVQLAFPGHESIHAVHSQAGAMALMAALLGGIVAYVLYGIRLIDPSEIQKQFRTLHRYLVDKWRFDELYDAMFVRPVHAVAKWFSGADKNILDRFLHGCASTTVAISRIDRKFDETVIDGLVNSLGRGTKSIGGSFRHLQTGRLRQYVMFIALGVVGLFVMLFVFFPKT